MRNIFFRIYHFIAFLFYYLVKLIQSNLYIAWDILTPTMRIQPGLVEVPLNIRSNFGLLLYGNLISMTPGSLSLDISEDKKSIKIHVLYLRDQVSLQKEFQRMQQRIKNFAE